MIHRVPEKQIRYDGVTVPGNPHHLSPTPSDPRKKPLPSLWRRMEDLDLPVPRMIIDEHYVGDPPKVEVTMDNLNDNIDKQFLSNRIGKYGDWELLHIEHHPVSKKHLGLARIVFKQVAAARECVAGLHGSRIMGKLVNCYLDPRFMMATKMFEDLTTDKKPSPVPELEEEEEKEVLDEKIINDDHTIGDEYDAYTDTRWRENSETTKEWNDHYEEDSWAEGRRRSRHRGQYEDDEYERGSRQRPSRSECNFSKICLGTVYRRQKSL